ncbi:MAG: silent information regulator protein Sir2 [Muribaculaceae bacterium]|nr:silent information regulator protein Sir2 [Muribaculaceae bacterium]
MRSLKFIAFLLCLGIFLPGFAEETVFAEYFDIPVGSPAGTEVMGRIHLKRNKDVKTNPIPEGYTFEILRQREGQEYFDIDTERDADGRIMGVLYVKDGATLPADRARYPLTVALKNGKKLVQKFPVKINAVKQTLWSDLYNRYVPQVINNPRLYGKKKLTDEEVATAIADLKAHDYRFSDELCYTKHPTEYPGQLDEIDHWKGGTIDYDYIRVCDRIGQLGYAYVKSPVYGMEGDPAKHAELRDVIIEAILAYTDIFPIEGSDMLIDGKPIGKYTGDGFSLLQKHKLAGHQIPTHQWTLTDPLMVPVLHLMPDILDGISQGDEKMQRLHDALVRYLQVFTSIVDGRRAIDNPKERWGLISDPNYSAGAWADANLGHRSRTMLALPIIWADYNRPMTYVPYWYDDFYPEKPYEGFNYAHGWSPHGVVADVAHWMTMSNIPAHHYAQSGFQPDGSISHHVSNGTDAAMAAYGFEWLTDLNTGFNYFKNTPYEVPGENFQFEIDRLLNIYPLFFYKQRMDNLIAGRSFMQDPKSFTLKTYPKGVNSLLKGVSKRTKIEGADSLRALVKALKAGRHETTATVPFWVNEYLLHRQGNENGKQPFFVSLKLKSERTVGAEDFDKKVRKSWHMGYGIMQTKVKGDEYDVPVLAQFDWHALPGLTEEWRKDPLPLKGGAQASKPGANKVAGVLADGTAGMAIYHHLTKEKYSSAQAFKSYGFVGEHAISQGSAISRHRKGTGENITTFIDQGALSSPLTICVDGKTTTIDAGQSVDLTFTSSKPMWMHIGAKGYVVVPEGESTLRVVTGSNVNVTDPAYKFKGKRGPGYILALDHGVNPAAGTDEYAYAVLPNANAEAMPALAADFAKDFTFVRNGANAHALSSHSNGLHQFAFFAPSSIKAGDITATASAPSQLMLRETADAYILSAGNPAPDDKNVTSLTFTLSKRLPAGTYAYRTGGIYPLDGETVTVADEGKGSRITVELPDFRDEEKYNYQTELYNAVPVVITIPKK